MKGSCGKEFKPYSSECEDCSYYSCYCMKNYKESLNRKITPFELEFQNNQEKFRKLGKVTTCEIDRFKLELEGYTVDKVIYALELYKEDK